MCQYCSTVRIVAPVSDDGFVQCKPMLPVILEIVFVIV